MGRCNSAPTPAGFCPAAQVNGVPDGRPDVLVSAFRVDYPTDGPDNEEDFDVGVNLMLDGATGAILQTYRHANPQKGSIFGFSITNQPAIGNVGGTAIPDVYIPAPGQDTDEYRGERIGYTMNGAALLSGNIFNLERFRSAHPAAHRGFSSTAARSSSSPPRRRSAAGAACASAARSRRSRRRRAATVKLRTVRALGGRQRTLPTASFQSPGNARRSVTVAVGTQTAALLRRARTLSVRAFIVGRDARGNSTTVVARLTLRTR